MKKLEFTIIMMVILLIGCAAVGEESAIYENDIAYYLMNIPEFSPTVMLKTQLRIDSVFFDSYVGLTKMVKQEHSLFSAIFQSEVPTLHSIITSDGIVKHMCVNGNEVTWATTCRTPDESDTTLLLDTDNIFADFKLLSDGNTIILRNTLTFDSEFFDTSFNPTELIEASDYVIDCLQVGTIPMVSIVTSDNVAKYLSYNGDEVTWLVQTSIITPEE